MDDIFTQLILSETVPNKLLTSIILMVSLWLLSRLLMTLIHRRTDDVKLLYYVRKLLSAGTVFLIFIFLTRIWFTNLASISTYLGLLSAGIAIALQRPLANMAGWFFIIGQRPFSVGDRIHIGDHRGDVIDVQPFQFTLLEIGHWVDADHSTGRLLHVPNAIVFEETLANYSKGLPYIWNEIPVLITLDSDWVLAKQKLQEIVDEHAPKLTQKAEKELRKVARHHMIQYGHLTPAIFTNVQASGILLTMRYLCEPRQRRTTTATLWEAILTMIGEEPQIALAYPSQMIYHTPVAPLE